MAFKLVFLGIFAVFALVETVAVAVHFQDMNVVGEPVQEGSGQAFGTKYLGPFVGGSIAGHQGGTALIALAEHLEQ